jgi:transposase
MGKRRRQFSREFKVEVIREVESGKTVAQVSRENQIHPLTIGRWQKEHRQYAEKAFAGNGILYKQEARISELERMIGQLAMENAFLKKALLRLEGQVRENKETGRK